MKTLIDVFLPQYDVRERHCVRVHASAAATYSALLRADLGSSAAAKLLLAVRALPGALTSGREGLRRLRRDASRPITLSTLETFGFRRLAAEVPRELVLGLEGKFWRPSGDLCTPGPAEFTGMPSPGTARAVWNFTIEECADGRTALRTETRVLCADAAVRRRFLVYWVVIRPFSGLLRRWMLRDVRRIAEHRAI